MAPERTKYAVRLALVLAISAVFAWSSPGLAANYGRGPGQGQGMGPPQEMVDACSGKAEGEACSFTSPRGEVPGFCAASNIGVLACRPQGGQGMGRGGQGMGQGMGAGAGMGRGQGRGLPPEAAAACSGKSVGDDCAFTMPMGEVTGSCAARNGVLTCCPRNGQGFGPQ